MNFSSQSFLKAGLTALMVAVGWSAQAVNLGNLPLWFESDRNSEGAATRFIAHGNDSEFAITATGAEFTLHRTDGHQASVQMTFAGAGTAQLTGESVLAGKINYLLGNDPAQWQTGIATFSKIRLNEIYPGVNVVYYGNQQQLEYDFDLAAGVNPETIAIRFDGAEKIFVNTAGELVVQLDGGLIAQHQPVAYQTIAGTRQPVSVSYHVTDDRTVKFTVGAFDHTQALVIDPVLGYSSFFGGNRGDSINAIAIDRTDNSIYVAGQTLSTTVSNNIPFATNSTGFFTNYAGGKILGDAFVAKFGSTGTNLIYCTYLGGSDEDGAYGLSVDDTGHAFVAGYTQSTNFPTLNAVHYGSFDGSHISGPYDTSLKSYRSDAFVAELQPDGSALVYSTFLGGNAYESAFAVANDTAGNAFVTGYTSSTNFPVTQATALQTNLACTNNMYVSANGFVAEIAAGGNQLNYASFLGGTNFDQGNSIAYNNGYVLVAGFTASTNFPVTTNGLAACKYLNGFTNRTGASDAFVTMFTTQGANLMLKYSTFLGSSNNDVATGIAADASGNAYVVGWTTSTNFPDTTTSNSLQINSYVRTNTTGFVFATNAFLTKIIWDNTNATLGFSRIFGGLGVDVANGVTLDSAGNIFIVGSASSTNFPVTGTSIFGSLRATNSGPNIFAPGASDVFVTAFKADFSTLLYSTYLGGKLDDFGQGIAVDGNGDAWVVGQTLSTNFPVLCPWTTNSALLHPFRVGTNDAFLTKILTTGGPTLQAASNHTNMFVFWTPVSDATSTNLGLETVTNLLRAYTITNPIYKITYTYQTNGPNITTNVTMTVTNTFLTTNIAFNNSWTVVTNTPVFTNGNYIYTFNPTNEMRFFRFHH